MLKVGDVVIYKHAVAPNNLEGTLAVIIGDKHGPSKYEVRIILPGPLTQINKTLDYWDAPFFRAENCQRIGTLEEVEK